MNIEIFPFVPETEMIAVVEGNKSISYRKLAYLSAAVRQSLLPASSEEESDYNFVASFLGIMQAGCMAVPIHPKHPHPEIEFTLKDSQTRKLLVSTNLRKLAEMLMDKIPELMITYIGPISFVGTLAELNSDIRNLMIYTSGSTGRPKGVVHTQGSLTSMITSLIQAWKIGSSDRILNVLPVHHIHGILNTLLVPLCAGGCVEFMTFEVWDRLQSGDISIFMDVPTIYAKMLQK